MWRLEAFDKVGEELVKESPLPELETEAVRSAYGQPDTNPMFDSYPLTPEIVGKLGPGLRLAEPLDFSAFDYFLEYYAD